MSYELRNAQWNSVFALITLLSLLEIREIDNVLENYRFWDFVDRVGEQ